MRKKYLSALLFGALLVTSAGTFTSCKDYDDDINNLQEQITSNKDAIAALQKLVSEGKWVTSISPIENGFTVTMSDGTTQNITGINGADGQDGKPGTVITLDPETNNWIIDGVDTGVCAKGEKGDQGEQGPAGENGQDGAQGEQGAQGEPGKNAPSPSIDPTTGCWVVYEWDATAGDYKAVKTEINAESTKVFVVEGEGFITLNVDGVEYTLPTTSDAYNVDAPYSSVKVRIETGRWNPTTTSADYNKLLKEFPEIAKIEKDSLLKQGAELPVLVTPSSIDLTKGFKFSLQSLNDGIVEDITLSNPTKGLSDEWRITYEQNPVYSDKDIDNNGYYDDIIGWVDGESYMTRGASKDDCFWTLQIDQKLVNNNYATAQDVALVVENANGKVVKTPFVYSINRISKVANVIINRGNNPKLADQIDLLAPVVLENGTKGAAPIYFNNEFEGKYIITLTDQIQVEKYGLEIVDGHKLVINNPGNDTSIPVSLNVIALGLNGSTANRNIAIYVSQTIEAGNNQLAEKNFTLSVKKAENSDTEAGQFITWDIDELGFTTATALQNFIYAGKTITLINEEGVEYTPNYGIEFIKADGTVTYSYKDAVKLRFKLLSGEVVPGSYKFVLEAKNGSTTIYKTETTMEIANPKKEDLFGLATAYTKDGILQVVGDVNENSVSYKIEEGVVKKIDLAKAELVAFEDLDYVNWLASDGSQSWGSENWVTGNQILIPIEGVLTDEGKNRMNKERKIRGTYTLFGKPENKVEYEFGVKVLSAVYTADGSNVKIDASKMAGTFGKTIDLTKGISATYAAGINVGKDLQLFDINTQASDIPYPVYGIDTYTATDEYVLDTTGKPIAIDKDDLIAFGMSPADYVNLDANKTLYLMESDQTISDGNNSRPYYYGWKTIMEDLLDVYESKEGALVLKSGYKPTDDAVTKLAAKKALFDKYSKLIDWDIDYKHVDAEVKDKAAEIKSVKFAFADNDALKYCSSIGSETGVISTKSDIAESDLVNGKAVVNVKVTVTDIWGLNMTKSFQVTITKE